MWIETTFCLARPGAAPSVAGHAAGRRPRAAYSSGVHSFAPATCGWRPVRARFRCGRMRPASQPLVVVCFLPSSTFLAYRRPPKVRHFRLFRRLRVMLLPSPSRISSNSARSGKPPHCRFIANGKTLARSVTLRQKRHPCSGRAECEAGSGARKM